jgi:hypothetical protein
MERNYSKEFYCNLLPSELQKRKQTILASLKDKLVEKRELVNGYSYRFPGSDEMLDELLEFVKTERKCCEFFSFKILLDPETKSSLLEITGNSGIKEFINTELEI